MTVDHTGERPFGRVKVQRAGQPVDPGFDVARRSVVERVVQPHGFLLVGHRIYLDLGSVPVPAGQRAACTESVGAAAVPVPGGPPGVAGPPGRRRASCRSAARSSLPLAVTGNRARPRTIRGTRYAGSKPTSWRRTPSGSLASSASSAAPGSA